MDGLCPQISYSSGPAAAILRSIREKVAPTTKMVDWCITGLVIGKAQNDWIDAGGLKLQCIVTATFSSGWC